MAFKRKREHRIGDRVTLALLRRPEWDGTVVDISEDKISTLFSVYWRNPAGRVHVYRENELQRV